MSFVNSKKVFSRKFLIFANEDAGYEAGCKPSGYVKLEVRDGKGMLRSVIHNIRPGNGAFEYVLYLVSPRLGGQPAFGLKAGTYRVESGKAELEWSFDPFSVGKSGYEIDKFDVFAVIVEYVDRPYQSRHDARKTSSGVICPLAAYTGSPGDWRESFKAGMQDALAGRQDAAEGVRDFVQEQSSRRQLDMPPGPGDMEQNRGDAQTKPLHAGPGRQDARQGKDKEAERYEKQPEQQDARTVKHFPDQAQPGAPEVVQPGGQPAGGPNKTSPGCAYFSGNLCGALANSRTGDDPCGSCMFKDGERAAETQSQGDISGLKSDLDKHFEISDPFHSRRSDYIWWKVTDPVSLNNILYRNGIRTPLMFNPAVMMSYYRYRHLIVGIFTHRTGQSFVVCGAPGMHMVDGKPFGEMGRWVQAEGSKPRYGSFGYWLAYIDPTDGRILEV
ncbi:MAG: hypothetical protein ACM3XR_01395 [Bacillota bacterium]